MLLADRYEVPKVHEAAYAAYLAVPVEQLEWQTALDVLDLPPSCAQQQGFAAVQCHAVQRLQKELGDLDICWSDERLAEQLQQLPFQALLPLLQHDDTRVASEHTVV
jgi:hypothetical protein